MCIATFMAILDTTVVNLGLHAIRGDLHVSLTVLQWVLDIYNLVYAGFILTGGVLGDLFMASMFSNGVSTGRLHPEATMIGLGSQDASHHARCGLRTSCGCALCCNRASGANECIPNPRRRTKITLRARSIRFPCLYLTCRRRWEWPL